MSTLTFVQCQNVMELVRYESNEKEQNDVIAIVVQNVNSINQEKM